MNLMNVWYGPRRDHPSQGTSSGGLLLHGEGGKSLFEYMLERPFPIAESVTGVNMRQRVIMRTI